MIERDPAQVERQNLINLCKLIVKELIDCSVQYGRQLDSDFVPLQHFFIVLEHALRHGLRPKKGLLGPKKELWDLLQLVEKTDQDAVDITTSVRDLPTVRTGLGRARAWIRLALMRKKLADYLKILFDQRDTGRLQEFYEPGALLLSDESVVLLGLLLGLNVVDCNLCLKVSTIHTSSNDMNNLIILTPLFSSGTYFSEVFCDMIQLINCRKVMCKFSFTEVEFRSLNRKKTWKASKGSSISRYTCAQGATVPAQQCQNRSKRLA